MGDRWETDGRRGRETDGRRGRETEGTRGRDTRKGRGDGTRKGSGFRMPGRRSFRDAREGTRSEEDERAEHHTDFFEIGASNASAIEKMVSARKQIPASTQTSSARRSTARRSGRSFVEKNRRVVSAQTRTMSSGSSFEEGGRNGRVFGSVRFVSFDAKSSAGMRASRFGRNVSRSESVKTRASSIDRMFSDKVDRDRISIYDSLTGRGSTRTVFFHEFVARPFYILFTLLETPFFARGFGQIRL